MNILIVTRPEISFFDLLKKKCFEVSGLAMWYDNLSS